MKVILSEKAVRRSVLMKFRSLLLSSILVVGVSLSAAAFVQDDKHQDDKQKPQTPSSQTQPADQNPAAAADQRQTQTQPAVQDQPAVDQDKDKGKKDKKDKKDAKAKQNGGKDDVDAIGNRKVTGMDWYSIETEIRM